MKLVYTHENRMLVANVENILTQAGIDVSLKNEFAAGAIGELASQNTWPELWVMNDADQDRATHIIEQTFASTRKPEWLCSHCGENNPGDFDSCWNCQRHDPKK